MFQKLIEWSQKEFSYIPWRKQRTLYSTLVSEIMLQQTTVSTVLNHFEKFMLQYPTLKDLAQASEQDLLISWKGLGYYRRARNLKKACEAICNEHNGKIPLDYEALINIPGIGDYTANAILAIGANENTMALDANLERVLARLFSLKEQKGLKLIKKIKRLDPVKNELELFGGRAVNEALMDLGRNFCQARKTQCDLCPLNSRCLALKNNLVSTLPLVKTSKNEKHTLTLLRVILKKDDKFLVYKKTQRQWLSGQFEVPTFILETSDNELNQYPHIEGQFDYLPEFKTAITKYSIINKVIWVNQSEFKQLGLKMSDFIWGNENLSTASTKAIDL